MLKARVLTFGVNRLITVTSIRGGEIRVAAVRIETSGSHIIGIPEPGLLE